MRPLLPRAAGRVIAWAFFLCGIASLLHAQATWTLRDSGTTANLWSGASNDKAIVVVGEQGTIVTSLDGGVTWTHCDSGTTMWLVAVTYSSAIGRFIAVGDGGTILSSADAVTWTRETSPTGIRLNGVSATGSTVYAVGEAGVGLLSRDVNGIWTQSDAPFSTRWMKTAHVAGRVVGQGGALYQTTTNASGVTTWQNILPPASVDLEDAAVGARPGYPDLIGITSLVLVGAGCVILQQLTDASWTVRTSGTTERLRSICWKQGVVLTVITNTVHVMIGEYFAVGAHGTMLRSRDGTAWQLDQVPTSDGLNSVFVFGEKVLCVGDSGTILQLGGSAAAPICSLNLSGGYPVPATISGTGCLTYYTLRDYYTPFACEGGPAKSLLLTDRYNSLINQNIDLIVANAFGYTYATLPATQCFLNLSTRAVVGAG